MPCYRVDGRRIRVAADLPLPVVAAGEADWTLDLERAEPERRATSVGADLGLRLRLRERAHDRGVDLVGTLLEAAQPRVDAATAPRHPVLGVIPRVAHLVRKHVRRASPRRASAAPPAASAPGGAP